MNTQEIMNDIKMRPLKPIIAQGSSGPVIIWVTPAVKAAIDSVPEEDRRLPEIHPEQKCKTRID